MCDLWSHVIIRIGETSSLPVQRFLVLSFYRNSLRIPQNSNKIWTLVYGKILSFYNHWTIEPCIDFDRYIYDFSGPCDIATQFSPDHIVQTKIGYNNHFISVFGTKGKTDFNWGNQNHIDDKTISDSQWDTINLHLLLYNKTSLLLVRIGMASCRFNIFVGLTSEIDSHPSLKCFWLRVSIFGNFCKKNFS